MKENFAAAMKHVFAYEGGWAERSTEPGGAVMRGVSFETFSKWRHDHGQPKPTFADLKNSTEAEATDIYRGMYASKVQFDTLPSGLDFAVLDSGINNGLGAAARLLAHAVNFNHPGTLFSVTPELAAAAAKAPALAVVDKLCDLRLAYMRQSPEWAQFHRGWEARVASVRQNAKAMAASSA